MHLLRILFLIGSKAHRVMHYSDELCVFHFYFHCVLHFCFKEIIWIQMQNPPFRVVDTIETRSWLVRAIVRAFYFFSVSTTRNAMFWFLTSYSGNKVLSFCNHLFYLDDMIAKNANSILCDKTRWFRPHSQNAKKTKTQKCRWSLFTGVGSIFLQIFCTPKLTFTAVLHTHEFCVKKTHSEKAPHGKTQTSVTTTRTHSFPACSDYLFLYDKTKKNKHENSQHISLCAKPWWFYFWKST